MSTNFKAEKLANLATLEEVEQEIFSDEEAYEVRHASEQRAKTRRALADQISKAIAHYMSDQDIGFNEFQRRLGVSSATASKLIKGDGNVTLETIALVSSLIGVIPELTFRKRA